MCVLWLFPFKSQCHPSFTQNERNSLWVIIPKVLSFVQPDSPLCFSSYDLLHLFPVHPRTVSVLTNTAWELIAYLGVAVSVDRQCFRRRCQPSIINTKWAVFRWGTQPVCNGILMWTPVMGFTFATPEFGNFQYNARPPSWWHTQKVGYWRSLWCLWMHYLLLYFL